MIAYRHAPGGRGGWRYESPRGVCSSLERRSGLSSTAETMTLTILIGSGYYLDHVPEIEILKTAVIAALDALAA